MDDHEWRAVDCPRQNSACIESCCTSRAELSQTKHMRVVRVARRAWRPVCTCSARQPLTILNCAGLSVLFTCLTPLATDTTGHARLARVSRLPRLRAGPGSCLSCHGLLPLVGSPRSKDKRRPDEGHGAQQLGLDKRCYSVPCSHGNLRQCGIHVVQASAGPTLRNS